MLDEGIPTGFFNFVDLVDQISQGFTLIQVILQAVALLIALVGALGLLTTLSMSVFERQKEIGVMRSIGASSSTVAGQFLTEGLVVGVIAWIVGLPLAVLIEALLLEVTGLTRHSAGVPGQCCPDWFGRDAGHSPRLRVCGRHSPPRGRPSPTFCATSSTILEMRVLGRGNS